MQLLVEQLERRTLELARWLEIEHTEPARVRLVRQGFDDAQATLLEPGGDWREPLNTTVWLRFGLERPAHWPVDQTALLAQRFGTLPVEPPLRIGIGLQRMQGLLYLDGQPYHGLDQYHRLIYLPPGPRYQLAASVWTGFAALDWQPAPIFRLVRVDPAATALYHDLRILADALRALERDHPARAKLEVIGHSALLAIDWSRPGSDAFRHSLLAAHEQVACELQGAGAAEYESRQLAVGHAHIDCAWLWPLSQTREKAGRTWSTALRLMERYPEYHFLASTPLQYEMVRETFPSTFEGIRQRVAEGRWEAVGGMWVEADCNIPDGESLVRQMLLGTRYFEQHFGVATRVVWLPDSFGFSWALPTLMAAAGLPYFLTHKLSWNQTNRIPHDTFRWRGPDGSEVLAHFLCTPEPSDLSRSSYNASLLPSTARAAWARFQDRDLQQELLVAFGYGDGGGGPSIDMLEGGLRLADLPGFPKVTFGRATEFFERLEARLEAAEDVPVWDGELYLEYHRGTYTGQARQKLRNALAQRLFHAAELFAASARAWLGVEYPRTELEAGWRLILTNQFHDILPGSAISDVYVDAERDFEQAREIGERILDDSLTRLTGAIGVEADSIVVFNPQPYASADYCELPATLQGQPSQALANGSHLVWCEGVPANGYAAFSVGQPTPSEARLSMSPREIDTPFWSLEIDQHGRIARCWDKRMQREVLTGPGNRLVAFEDRPLHWDAWDIDAFHTRKAREVDQLVSAQVLESGPERGVLELRWQLGQGTSIVQHMHVSARNPRIDFVTEVDWRERQTLLKVGFPTGIRNRRATYEIQFGTIDRPTHRNTSWEEAAFEVPAQRWLDLSDAHYGVALLADCKHGYSVRERTLWLSLLKGAIDPDPEADLGTHRFTYSLLPHAAGLDGVRQAAYALTRPLLWRRAAAHAGGLPSRASIASADDALIETIKWAEDEDALIVRCYEPDGATRAASLSLGVDGPVDQVTLLERDPSRVDPARLTFRAHEVKTLRVHPGKPAAGFSV